MRIAIDNTIPSGEQDIDAAWEVFRALSLHLSANPELDENTYFKRAMTDAHNHYLNMFAAG